MVNRLKVAKLHREVEMYDDDDRPLQESMNWADVTWSLLVIPRYMFKGCMVATENLQKCFACTSKSIDKKRRFAREAGAAIESMTRGDT